jgi:hypothetical protein
MTCKSAQLIIERCHRHGGKTASRLKFHKPSSREVAYAAGVGIASLVTYWIMFSLLPGLAGTSSTPVANIWAVISVAFVYKNTRSYSMSAGISRLIGTLINVSALFGFPRIVSAFASRHGNPDYDRHDCHDMAGPFRRN